MLSFSINHLISWIQTPQSINTNLFCTCVLWIESTKCNQLPYWFTRPRRRITLFSFTVSSQQKSTGEMWQLFNYYPRSLSLSSSVKKKVFCSHWKIYSIYAGFVHVLWWGDWYNLKINNNKNCDNVALVFHGINLFIVANIWYWIDFFLLFFFGNQRKRIRLCGLWAENVVKVKWESTHVFKGIPEPAKQTYQKVESERGKKIILLCRHRRRGTILSKHT